MANNIFDFVLILQERFKLDLADTMATFAHVAEVLSTIQEPTETYAKDEINELYD